MQLRGLDLWLWLAGFLGSLALLIVLWACGRVRTFPIFTACISLDVVRTITLFFVYRYGSFSAYYYTYVCLGAVNLLLEVAVAYEVALHVFRPAGRWVPGTEKSFLLVTGSALLLAAALSWLALPATKYLTDTLLIRGKLMSAAFLSELFVAMLALSVHFGMRWRTHIARIAQGFGIYSLVCLAAEALHTYFGVKSGTDLFRVVSRSRIAVYQAVVVYWIIVLSRDAAAERPMPEPLQLQLRALQQRTTAMLNLLQGRRA